MKRLIYLICFIFITSLCFAVNDDVSTTGAQFLKISVGARPSAMGDAYVGIADDCNALQFNPAGIITAEQGQIAFQTMQWFVDTRLHSLSFIHPDVGFGAIGFNLKIVDYGILDGYDEYGNYTDAFSPYDIAFTGAFAREVIENLSVGINLKYIDMNIEGASSKPIAFDFGFLYRMEIMDRDLRIGLALQNFGGKVKFIEESYDLPQNLVLGASYKVFEDNTHSMLAALDLAQPIDNDAKINFGAEYCFREMIYGRLGYKAGAYDVESLTCGLGVKYEMEGVVFGCDFSYGSISEELDDTLRFGIHIGF